MARCLTLTREFLAVFLALFIGFSAWFCVELYRVAVMDEKATLDEMSRDLGEIQALLEKLSEPLIGDFWLPGEFERMVEEKVRYRRTPEEDNI